MLKKLFAHSLIYSLAPQAPKIASLLLLPIITKHVTTSDYGIYGIISSYLFFLTALKDLGFGVVFVNTFYKHKTRWPFIWRLLHGHLILWSFIFSLIMLFLLRIAVPNDAISNYWTIAFLVIVPAVFFDTTNLIGNYYYRFSQKPLFIAIVSIVTGCASVIITYFCIVSLNLGYMGWFIASFFSSFIAFVFYFIPVYYSLHLIPIIRFRKKFITPHLKVALPMVPHNYSSYLLNSSDRVVLDLYKVPIQQIGQYNIAYTFGNYFESIGEAIGMAVGPFYSKLYSNNTEASLKDERRLTYFLMTGFIAAAFLVSLWLKEIFAILISNVELRSAYGIGILIIMGYAYRPMYWSVGIKLSIFEKTSLLWRISFIAGVLNVICNVIFIPKYGIFAAAFSTLVSLLFIGFSGFFFSAYKKLNSLNHHPFIWFLSIILLTVLAYLSKDESIYLKAVFSIIIILGLTYAFLRNFSVLKSIKV